MKKLSKLKLTKFSQRELEDRQMNALRGGYGEDGSCSCLCQGGATGDASSASGCKKADNTGCS